MGQIGNECGRKEGIGRWMKRGNRPFLVQVSSDQLISEGTGNWKILILEYAMCIYVSGYEVSLNRKTALIRKFETKLG